MIAKCIVCKKEFNWEPEACCDGQFCNCGGGSLEPQVCDDCFDKLYYSDDNKYTLEE